MSDEIKRELPYHTLGLRLKRLREKLQETVAEVSGAVEIDVDALQRYERGESRPGEDILQLLISHFSMKETEATKLWQLAGYDPKHMDNEELLTEPSTSVASVIVLPMDARIAYTDMVNVMVNDYGVVINFLQGNGPNSQPLVVSRLGMSKEHARSVLAVLQKTLQQSEPKSLPPSAEHPDKHDSRE